MPVEAFPNPSSAGDDGIVAVGGDLHPQSLMMAYRQGIFPWPMEGLPLVWFCPKERGILVFEKLTISKSFRKILQNHSFKITKDEAFEEVIHQCAVVPRKDHSENAIDRDSKTWITEELEQAYVHFHELGHAHSFEVWRNGKLVGGIYGVAVEGVFSAESMFHKVDNASKVCLVHLIEHLKTAGATWMDIQMVTPHMELLGASVMSRDDFLEKLAMTQSQKLKLF